MTYRPGSPAMRHVEAAARRLAGLAWRTPTVRSSWLSDRVGGDVFLKLEIVQATGSFKIRGAANAVGRLREIRRGVTTVMTASAGNHGLALAMAARHFGLAARVHLPATAPAAKRQALEELGAEVIEAPDYDAAEAAARDEAAADTVAFISPYNDEFVIAGAATATLELLEDQPDLDDVIVPIGGGGLAAGAGIVVERKAPRGRVIAAEAEASPVFSSALAAGHPVTVDVKPTLADGLAGNMDPESITFPLVRDLVERVVAVPEDAIAAAMRDLLYNDRLVAEGAAATAVAAVTSGALDLAGRRVGIILSGRNVDLRDRVTLTL